MSLEFSQSDLGGSSSDDSNRDDSNRVGSNRGDYRAEESAAFESLFETAVYDRYDREMDERVDQLIGRWVHLAAPNAGRGRRLFAAIGTPPKKNAS